MPAKKTKAEKKIEFEEVIEPSEEPEWEGDLFEPEEEPTPTVEVEVAKPVIDLGTEMIDSGSIKSKVVGLE